MSHEREHRIFQLLEVIALELLNIKHEQHRMNTALQTALIAEESDLKAILDALNGIGSGISTLETQLSDLQNNGTLSPEDLAAVAQMRTDTAALVAKANGVLVSLTPTAASETPGPAADSGTPTPAGDPAAGTTGDVPTVAGI